MLKKLLFPLLAAFILAGCASSNNTLTIQPKIQLPQRDPSLMRSQPDGHHRQH